ncbi:type 4 fimbrial assembly protein PilB [Steroidobacter agaridevorans]|uniref:Type 4 fimbrial assembly protein PilB n=1 Tax=Steroidobacter agaridevorans TaxID=2695856 RepID=A0A829Y7U0_9GAMM|nr:type IV-A pilus assembly ATPase PilB [Steroidobacter agaridevorans]GFE79071.1 type 4 fimbrial assembly protein PilB [Steroidobacter agaridevorans]
MAENVVPALANQRMVLQGLPHRLIQDGLVDEQTMVQAMAAAKESDGNLVSHLVSKGIADAKEIAIAASQEFGVPLLDLDAAQLDLDVVKLVSDKLLAKHRVLPLLKRGKRLFIAVSDPTNLHALDEIKFQTGLSIEAVVVEDDKLQKIASKAMEQVDTQMPAMSDEDLDLENLDVSSGDEDDAAAAAAGRDDVEDAPIVRFVNKVLLDAIKRGASDIHFEPYEKSYRIRLRLDGFLKEIASPPVQLAVKLAARIKVMSRLDIAERRIPQDGRIKMRISKNRAIDFRVSTCPTLFGEKIVARILDPSSAMLGIDALGYEPAQKDLYMTALAQPHGMILVTGPTGSGKTVSLYTGLNILNKEDTNISTAEDPAEINLPGVNQVNVNPKVGLTFASALRAFLRQDPDVIMVGEIRDLETAEIAIKAAQTGHLVLSTLHTNDAPKTLTRLIDMGVKPYAIATSVSLIIAQRLARRLCNNCKVPMEMPPEALLKEGFTQEEIDEGIQIYKPVGCSSCTDGYKGRTGLYQVMPVSEEIQRIILQEGNAVDIAAQSAKEGIWDLRKSGLSKVKAGITSLDEVNQCTVE